VSVDLAVGGAAFLDLTFVGLSEIPAPGQERHADDLLGSPGGAAISAIGAARLGLTVALCSALGNDYAGRFLRTQLAAEGVRLAGPITDRTPVTVVLPSHGDRAMATFDPRHALRADDLARLEPRAVLLGLGDAGLAPPDALVYLGVGDAEADAHAGGLPEHVRGARALFANEGEALRLSGEDDAEYAARALAEQVETAVVTLGPAGALAAAGGRVHRAQGPRAEVVNPTGAGDLFAAAWIWADLRGAAVQDRLVWATLAAAHSVRHHVVADAAVPLAALVAAGAEIGLPAPAARSATVTGHKE
jgi:sugar/nucleoside kinase (ribokinase family)